MIYEPVPRPTVGGPAVNVFGNYRQQLIDQELARDKERAKNIDERQLNKIK